MLAGRLVQDHLTQGHLSHGAPGCGTAGNASVSCLALGRFLPDPGRRGAVQTGMGWVPDAQGRSARAVSVRGRSTRRVGPFVRSSCGNRLAACTQTARSALAARGCPSACRAGDRSALAVQGRASVFAVRDRPFNACSVGRPSAFAQAPPVFGSCRRASSGAAQRT